MTDEANEGLLAKRDELLNEVKKLKARLAEVERERDAAAQRADKAEAEFQRVTLDEPVEAVLSQVFAVPLRYVLPDLKEDYSFERDDDGVIAFRTKDGEPVTVKDREAAFTAADIYEALAEGGQFDGVLKSSGAQGSGSLGGRADTRTAPREKQKAAVASPFGLR